MFFLHLIYCYINRIFCNVNNVDNTTYKIESIVLIEYFVM